MKFILTRSYEGCYFTEDNVFRFPFKTKYQAEEAIKIIKNYKEINNSLDFITGTKESRLIKEWAEDCTIGPATYLISPIENS